MTTSPKASKDLAATIVVMLGTLAPAAVLFFSAQPAAAQTARTAPVAEVRIELQAKAPETVRSEITMAARRLCEAEAIHSPLAPRDLMRCRKESASHAMAQLPSTATQFASRD